MAEDSLRFEATFNELNAAVARMVDETIQEAAQVRALGDEARASMLEARAVALQGGAAATPAPQVANELTRQNALKELGIKLDADSLSEITRQNEAYVEQQALLQRLQEQKAASAAESGSLLLPQGRIYTDYGQTIGQQAELERQVTLAQQQQAEALAAEAAARERNMALAEEQLALDREQALVLAQQQATLDRMDAAYAAGATAAGRGGLVGAAQRDRLINQPPPPIEGVAAEWGNAERAAVRYNVALGEYNTFSRDASLSSEALTANLTRLGLADAQASNALRQHGALTTEFLSALARGETTVSEFGYQIGATIGKFAGWTAAATATYTALGAVVELGKGAIDAASGVQQLNRTIDNVDPEKASTAIQNLSQETNVPIKEASDTMFAFSRTFHNVEDAATAARLALSAYKLDGVSVNDTVKAATALHQQFGLSAQGLIPIFDQLAQGQQKFNARITDQIPLLQKSASAVKNAGGDLRDFIEISTIFLRTTQLTGTQGGTAFARSAANFLNPDTTKGQADRAVLQSLGIDPNQNYTQLIFDALRKSPQMTDDQRRQLGLAIFGPQLGARTAGFFTGGAALLPPVQRELSPAGAKDTLQVELQKQLATASETLHSFVNALQRIGAAAADSGVLTAFGLALHGIVAGLDAFRGVIDTFDQLPSAAKEAISTLVELRLAMLLLSRTGIGRSIPGSRFARIPGIDPSFTEQNQRADLTIGTRNAIQAIDDSIAQTTAQLATNGARQLTLEQRQAAIVADVEKAGVLTVEQLEQANEISAKIAALKRQQTELEAERNAQEAAQAKLNDQLVGLTARGNKRLTAPQVAALQSQVDDGTQAAEVAQTDAEAAALNADTKAQGRIGAAKARLASALRLNTAAESETAAAVAEESVAANSMAAQADVTAAETKTAGGFLTRAAGGLGGVAASLDPLLVGMVGLPLVYEQIKNAIDGVSQAADQAAKDGKLVDSSLSGLREHVAKLQADSKKQADASSPGGLLGVLETPFVEASKLVSSLTGVKSIPGISAARDTADLANQLKAIADLFHAGTTTLERDTKAWVTTNQARKGLTEAAAREAEQFKTLQNAGIIPSWLGEATKTFHPEETLIANTNEGRKLLIEQADQLKAQFRTVLQGSGLPQKEIKSLYQAFADKIKQELSGALLNAPIDSKDPFAALEQLSAKQIEQQVQRLDDYVKVFGTTGSGSQALKKAALDYAYLANKFGGSSKDADLQALATAQSNFISAVTKNVQDLLHASQSDTTQSAETGDVNAAIAAIDNAKRIEQQALDAIIAKDKGNAQAIARARAAADQIFAQLNDQLKSALTQQLALIQQQSDLQVSEIQGISPESDVQRAQVALSGLEQELAKARAEHADWQTVAGLQQKINDAQNALVKQQISNADAIAQAQGAVALASISGNSPKADLQRAQQTITNARNKLAQDQANNAGEAAILNDQAALDDALNALNNLIKTQAQQLDQELAAYISSKAALAQSRTQNPTKQAQDQLAADIKLLTTIRRSDFDSQKAYLTALNNQRAKINTDRQNVQQQIVQADLNTLAFESSVGKLTDQAYISGLQRILHSKKLTLDERRQIETQIYQLQHQLTTGASGTTNALDLNVGNIKLPSVYEVRQSIAAAQQGQLPAAANTVVNSSVSVVVNVNGGGDASKVGQVLDDHLNTTVRAAMRAKGVI